VMNASLPAHSASFLSPTERNQAIKSLLRKFLPKEFHLWDSNPFNPELTVVSRPSSPQFHMPGHHEQHNGRNREIRRRNRIRGVRRCG
jgi:hypothetical protein